MFFAWYSSFRRAVKTEPLILADWTNILYVLVLIVLASSSFLTIYGPVYYVILVLTVLASSKDKTFNARRSCLAIYGPVHDSFCRAVKVSKGEKIRN